MTNLGKAVLIFGQEIAKSFRETCKAFHVYNQFYKLINGTRAERCRKKKVHRWVKLGAEIFFCEPVYLRRLWEIPRDTPLTIEEIVKYAIYLGAEAKIGMKSRMVGVEKSRKIIVD